MDDKINSISVSRMDKGAHLNFMKTTIDYLDGSDSVKEKVTTEYSALSSAIATEELYFNVPRKSESTEEIENSDKLRDLHYSAYVDAVKYVTKTESDATKLTYAKRLLQNIEESGISTRSQRDTQTGKMLKFTSELETAYATEIESLGLGKLVEAMKRENENVRAHTEDRTEEYSTRVKGALKKARSATDDAYRKLIEKINALIVIEGGDGFSDFVSKLNAEIDRYKREVLGQSSSSSGSNNDSDLPVTDDKPSTGSGNDGEGDENLPPVQ